MSAIRLLEDSGAGAVVLPSLFEEQIRQEELQAEMLTSIGAESSPEASSYFPAGPGHLRSLLSGLETWLKARDFDSVTAIKGLMRPPLGAKAEARERVNYVESLLSYRGPDVRR
jgi:hypothetical protein